MVGPSERTLDRIVWSTFAILAAATAVTLFVLGRGLIFFFDEWNIILERRSGVIDPLLRPHNGHAAAVPVVVYRVLFEVVGLKHYGPYRLAVIAVHLVCSLLVFVHSKRRTSPTVALGLAGLLLCYGRAWEDLLWPFQIGFLASLAAGVGALLAMDVRRDRTAAALVCISLASSGIGVPVVAGLSAEIALRRDFRRAWVAVLPGLLYVVWFLTYGESQARMENVTKVPGFMASAAADAVGGLFGVGGGYGQLLAAAVVIALVILVVAKRSLPVRAAFGLASAGVFWALTALTRGDIGDPSSSRYLYPAAVFLLLAAAELIPQHVRGSAIGVGVCVIAALATWGNFDELLAGRGGLRANSQVVSAELAAMELARADVAEEYRPDLQRMPQVFAGPYLRAVERFGSPAMPAGQVRSTPEPVRQAADAVLRSALGLELRAAGSSSVTDQRTCRAVGGNSGERRLEPGTTIFVATGAAPAELRLRRFAHSLPPEPFAVVHDGRAALTLPAPPVGRGWYVGASVPVSLCET